MRFEDFARMHGLVMRDLIMHRWVSTPTEDHPRKRNGRYKFLGDVGWVQNWATMTMPVMWKNQAANPVAIQRAIQQADKKREEDAANAARKAAWILHQTKRATHPYLDAKGFEGVRGNVWEREGQKLLIVPMRIEGDLVGVQIINESGEKKFLYGARTQGASFTVDAKGVPIFCEGLATALSVREAMRFMKVRYRIEVCFSAGNLKHISRKIPGGLVVADNDASGVGVRSALETQKPYWVSSTQGDDFNDYHIREGIRAAAESLKPIVLAATSR